MHNKPSFTPSLFNAQSGFHAELGFGDVSKISVRSSSAGACLTSPLFLQL